MPVDKFGRMDEVKPSEDGISISYVNNIFLRKDGTTEVTGSINMNGNTLTRVSNPANPQDVATKHYVDVKGGFLLENGGYHMLGYLNMGFNKIKNLADPTDPSEAINKKYADNIGGGIVKLQDGSFSAAGDIDMGGNRIKNLPKPAAWDDPVTRSFLSTQLLALSTRKEEEKSLSRNDDGSFTANGEINMNGKRIMNLPKPEGNNDPVTRNFLTEWLASFSAGFILIIRRERPKPIISIHAEEQGPLSNGNYEFSFGNGSSGRSHGLGGYCMSAPGRIIRGSLTVLKGSDFLNEEAKINLVINGIEKTDYSLIKNVGDGCSCVVFPRPLEVNQCDVINFLTKTDIPSAKNSYLTILVELDL